MGSSRSAAPNHAPEAGRRSLEGYLSGIIIRSAEIEPQGMVLLDDLALVHYFVVLETENDDGVPVHSRVRITHTWLNTSDGWKIIGGMSSA